MPYDRDSGAPAYGDANTNIRVDFVYGNMPIQPNDDRESGDQSGLSVMDSHDIAATEWNNYPVTAADAATNILINDGQTLEGGGVFYWPALGWCNGVDGEQAKVEHFFTYLRELGVNPAHLKDFTFSGGDNEWDASEDQPNWDGCVFYSYVPEEQYMGQDDQGVPVYGSDVEGEIIYGSWNTGQEVDIDTPNPEDFAVIVFSNDPRKDNAGWWGF